MRQKILKIFFLQKLKAVKESIDIQITFASEFRKFSLKRTLFRTLYKIKSIQKEYRALTQIHAPISPISRQRPKKNIFYLRNFLKITKYILQNKIRALVRPAFDKIQTFSEEVQLVNEQKSAFKQGKRPSDISVDQWMGLMRTESLKKIQKKVKQKIETRKATHYGKEKKVPSRSKSKTSRNNTESEGRSKGRVINKASIDNGLKSLDRPKRKYHKNKHTKVFRREKIKKSEKAGIKLTSKQYSLVKNDIYDSQNALKGFQSSTFRGSSGKISFYSPEEYLKKNMNSRDKLLMEVNIPKFEGGHAHHPLKPSNNTLSSKSLYDLTKDEEEIYKDIQQSDVPSPYVQNKTFDFNNTIPISDLNRSKDYHLQGFPPEEQELLNLSDYSSIDHVNYTDRSNNRATNLHLKQLKQLVMTGTQSPQQIEFLTSRQNSANSLRMSSKLHEKQVIKPKEISLLDFSSNERDKNNQWNKPRWSSSSNSPDSDQIVFNSTGSKEHDQAKKERIDTIMQKQDMVGNNAMYAQVIHSFKKKREVKLKGYNKFRLLYISLMFSQEVVRNAGVQSGGQARNLEPNVQHL